VVQYKSYLRERNEAGPTDWAHVNNHKYWSSKRKLWPHLADVALTWMEIPTSSIAAERTFAQARIVDAPRRQAQKWETFCREVKLRVNKSVLYDMLNSELAKL
jgi:hypothetical protein